MSISEDAAICIDRSTLQSVYTWNHKITIIGGAPPRLMSIASQLVRYHPTTQPWATPESTDMLRL